MSEPRPNSLWASLALPFKIILFAGLAVAGYGLYTWGLGVDQEIPATQAWVSVYGLPIPYLGAVATATVILALGTAALAYAAYLQSVATREQAESAERMRKHEIRPNLDLRAVSRMGGHVLPDVFEMMDADATVRVALRNLGPGNATDIKVILNRWWTPTDRLAEKLAEYQGGSFGRPVLPVSGREWRPLDAALRIPFALRANEDRPLDLQFRIGPAPDPLQTFAEQLAIFLQGKDVEGHEIEPKRMGLRLEMALSSPNSATGPIEYRFVYRQLTDEEIGHLNPAMPPHDVLHQERDGFERRTVIRR